MAMDIKAKLAEARIQRVAVVDDDFSKEITQADLEAYDASALLNDQMDPDRQAYWELLSANDIDPNDLADPASPLSIDDIRKAAPARLREAAETILSSRAQNAAPVELVISVLEELGIDKDSIDRYHSPNIPDYRTYDLLIVDYFLVDTQKTETLPFIKKIVNSHQSQRLPLQVILMSSHEAQLKIDFKYIRPELEFSSSRVRIMEKPRSDAHVIAWKSAIAQLASDRRCVNTLESFLRDMGQTLRNSAESTAAQLWELDLQAMDLLHELSSKDNDDYTRYMEDAVSRRLLSTLEDAGGARKSLRKLDISLSKHRSFGLLAATSEIGDSRTAIRDFMHSMQWRSGKPVRQDFPTNSGESQRVNWIRKHLRFGMVLRDSNDVDWLNITQACDLAHATDISHSMLLFVRGQRNLPSGRPSGEYYVSMNAMMAPSDSHVLTWNLRDIRTESIKDFSTTFMDGWQVAGELRADVAQNIVAAFGARAARVGLARTFPTWRVMGIALHVSELLGTDLATPLLGVRLEGHAIQRATAEQDKHELHLTPSSIEDLLQRYDKTPHNSVLELMNGVSISRASKPKLNEHLVTVHCETEPLDANAAKTALGVSPESNKALKWLNNNKNKDCVLAFFWAAS